VTDRLPPLPEDDDALEALMQTHLEPVTPSPELSSRTLAELRRRAAPADARPGAFALSALALAALLLVVLYALQAGVPGGVAPLTPGDQEQGPAEGPIADEEQDPVEGPIADEEQDPAEGLAEQEPVIADTWTFKPGEAPAFEADMDYGQLRLLLKADTIAIGKVARVDAQGAGVLEGVEVIRGEAPKKAPTVGEFNGCEGVPDFSRLVGQRVCVFLVRANNELQLLHGSSGIQRLPFRGKLGAAALKALVQSGKLEAKQLEALVAAEGPSVLTWLEGQLPGSAAGALESPQVQGALRDRLAGLAVETPRGDVMAIARFLRATTLSAEELSALWSYNETFTSNRLGAYVRGKPGYSNRVEDHVAFLRFMGRYDTALALVQSEIGLDRVRRQAEQRKAPPAWGKLYADLKDELNARLDEQKQRR